MKIGKSEEDKVINKCKMPWELLLAGKGWDEIAVMPEEEIYELARSNQKSKRQ